MANWTWKQVLTPALKVSKPMICQGERHIATVEARGEDAIAFANRIIRAVNCYEKVLDIASADYADDNEAANALLRIKGICEA